MTIDEIARKEFGYPDLRVKCASCGSQNTIGNADAYGCVDCEEHDVLPPDVWRQFRDAIND